MRNLLYTNETIFLYVLSVPKVTFQKYPVILVRSASSKAKQVDIQFKNFMLNEDETYGIIGNCFTIGNATLCEKSVFKEIPEDSYESRLLKGENANCHYIKNDVEIIELINDNTIFVTKIDGFLTNEKETRTTATKIQVFT